MGKVYLTQAILSFPMDLIMSKSVDDWSRVIYQHGLMPGPYGSLENYDEVVKSLYFAYVSDSALVLEEFGEWYDEIKDSIRVWTDDEVGLPNLEEGFSVGEAKEDPTARYVRRT